MHSIQFLPYFESILRVVAKGDRVLRRTVLGQPRSVATNGLREKPGVPAYIYCVEEVKSRFQVDPENT